MRLVMHKEKGFTLIELLFAIAILAIGIMGYTLLKSSNKYSRQYSLDTSQAVQLGMAQMEDFIIRGYDSGLLSAGIHNYDPEISATLPQIGDFQLDSATWTVRDNYPSQYLKTIDVTATWGTGTAAKSVTVTNVLVDR